MSDATATDFDVIIAGAGPAGLVLAIDLGRRGVRTLLLEKDPSTKAWPKMDRSNARTMEIFRRLGLADQVRSLGYPAEQSMNVLITSTSLAGEPILTLEYPSVAAHREVIARSQDGGEPLEPYQLVSQNDLEPLLAQTVAGIDTVVLRFGHELVEFSQDTDGVTAQVRELDGATHVVRAGYLVGCDGGNSVVRKQLDIALSGRGNIAELNQVTFRSDGLHDALPTQNLARHYYFADEPGSSMIMQGSRKQFTLNMRVSDEPFHAEEEIRKRLGVDIDLEILNHGQWKMHLLLAERYGEGRVFIAGDAAHLVIPTGGLGMNSAVGDAVDLAWKLAAVVHGWGDPELLLTYEIERRPVGARNVEASGWAAEGMFTWQTLWGPEINDDTEAGAALRARIRATADEYHRRVHEMLGVELGYSYAGSPVIATEDGDPRAWDIVSYEPHARPGVRLPHIWLSNGEAVQDLAGAGFTLFDWSGSADVSAWVAAFKARGVPLSVVARDEVRGRTVHGASLVLVRPDLHVAWRGETAADPERLLDLVTGRLMGVGAGGGDA